MVYLGFEPGVADWKAQANPLSYDGIPISVTRYWSKSLAQIDTTAVFPLRIPFQTSPISHQCLWTTFVSKFVTKNHRGFLESACRAGWAYFFAN